MKISSPQITQENKQVFYRVAVESIRGSETLWYSLDEPCGDLVSTSCDAPLVGLLIPAMAAGEDIHVDGVLSEKLFYNLSGPYQKLLQLVIPSLRPVRITADTVCGSQACRAPGVATGFSGGIDSYCALADHYYSRVSSGFKITHLLYNNVGSHGKDGERLFRKRFERLAPIAERLGLPFVKVDSNLGKFYGKGLGFSKTDTPRNASVALLLQGGIGRCMYASSYSYAHVFVGPSKYMSFTESISLPLLSTETLDIFSVGGHYTRVEKTLRVAEVPDSYGSLDVCARTLPDAAATNCSTCQKCLRTLATLEIAGLLERYSSSFDLAAYRRHRTMFFASMLGSSNPFHTEIMEFCRQRNFPYPLSSRILHALGAHRLVNLYERLLRNVKQPPGKL